jgi:predicted peptidase
MSGDRLRASLWAIEPTRLAHRLDASRTWLFTAEQDRVVPLENAIALARAASLPATHHVRVRANHYTAVVYFPLILQQMGEIIRSGAPESH